MNPLIKYAIAVAVVFGALFGAYEFGCHVTTNAFDAQIARDAAHHADELVQLENAFRKQEQDHAQAIAAIDAQHQKDIENEKAKTSAALAAYDAGSLRLRDKFTCAAATSAVSDTAASTGKRDAAKGIRLQRDDVQFFIREASRADQVADQLRACQGVVRADRADRPQ